VTLHPHAAGLYPLADPAWRSKIFRGGLVLMLPVVGWPAVLGYRSAVVRHLFGDLPGPLPPWEGRFGSYVVAGFRAMGVIFGQLSPLYGALAALVLARGFRPDATTVLVAAFFLLFPLFSTLSFPVACLLLACGRDRAWISPLETAGFLACFALVVFLIPAGFLQVSRTGYYRDAFRLGRTLAFLREHLRAYLQAWWYSGLMSLLGHLALPVAPWGVVWAYLAIIHLFNEILHHAGLMTTRGWLAAALADPRFAPRSRAGLARIADATGRPARVLDVGAFAVPLPGRPC